MEIYVFLSGRINAVLPYCHVAVAVNLEEHTEGGRSRKTRK
jgi:hypothetical protein